MLVLVKRPRSDFPLHRGSVDTELHLVHYQQFSTLQINCNYLQSFDSSPCGASMLSADGQDKVSPSNGVSTSGVTTNTNDVIAPEKSKQTPSTTIKTPVSSDFDIRNAILLKQSKEKLLLFLLWKLALILLCWFNNNGITSAIWDMWDFKQLWVILLWQNRELLALEHQ